MPRGTFSTVRLLQMSTPLRFGTGRHVGVSSRRAAAAAKFRSPQSWLLIAGTASGLERPPPMLPRRATSAVTQSVRFSPEVGARLCWLVA